jgi:trk system potassium uptake protein TrkA
MKRILLVGGYRKTISLINSLIKKGYKVTVINDDYEKCLHLAKIQGINVINGDGTKPFILEEAEANCANIAIALTNDDASNLIISELCKKKHHVPKTVALVSDPNKTEFFHKMGVDSVVCAISVITNIIEQNAIIEQISNSIPIGDGRVGITEIIIDDFSPVLGKKLWEIDLPREAIIGCILRGDITIIPRGDTRINSGDTLVLISSSLNKDDAITQLTGK